MTMKTTVKSSENNFKKYNEKEQPLIWMYQNKYPIAYEKRIIGAKRHNDQQQRQSPVLLLNGFGMGTFHQHRLMEKLSSHDNNNKQYNGIIYAIDYLGQGKSWPIDCNDGDSESEFGLRYCANTWIDQIIQFIENVVVDDDHNNTEDNENNNKKVHVVGNSVGGHLAVYIAASRPDLIASLVLINATPVWGSNLPGWDGKLPAPPIPRLIGRVLFDIMRDHKTIRDFLKETYVNENAYDDQFIQQVHDCTTGTGGHAAFASILWSPPASVLLRDGTYMSDFYSCLENIQCDVLLCFGKDDPWCKPVFARRMLENLQKRNDATTSTTQQRYIELSNVGHCANHEAPNAMSYLLDKWLSSKHTNRKSIPLLSFDYNSNNMISNEDEEKSVMIIKENWGETTLQEKQINQIPVSFIDKVAVTFL